MTVLVVDDEHAFFGSQNFTNYSIGSIEITTQISRSEDDADGNDDGPRCGPARARVEGPFAAGAGVHRGWAAGWVDRGLSARRDCGGGGADRQDADRPAV